MRSFIFHGNKINLSIWFDTITIYEKPTINNGFPSSGPIFEFSLAKKLQNLTQSQTWYADGILGVSRYVHQSDHAHVQYHQDDLGIADNHYHVQFRNPIRLEKLQEILESLFQEMLLTEIERHTILNSYQYQNSFKFEFNEAEQRFENELFKFGLKVNTLKQSAEYSTNYKEAYKVAALLHQRLGMAWDNYLEIRDVAAYECFKKECTKAIALARPELEKYRGYKQILWNLALFVSLLGVGYLIAGCFNLAYTNQFMFFNTDSAEKLNQLENDLQDVPAPVF